MDLEKLALLILRKTLNQNSPFNCWYGEIVSIDPMEDNQTDYVTMKIKFAEGNSKQYPEAAKNQLGKPALMVVP